MATPTEGASRRTFDEGDSFYDLYNQLGSVYQKQLDPYLSYNYKNGVWDKFGNFLGFNTGEDRYRMEMQDRARQAAAALANDQFQNDYNSAQQQAARQRDAGLNPDLAGETSGEGAAQMEQPLSPIDPSVFEVPKEVFADITSIFGIASNTMTSVASFSKMMAERDSIRANTLKTEVDSVQSAWDTAGNWLSSFDPATRTNFNVDVTDDMTDEEKRNVLKEAIVSAFKADYPGISKKSQDLLNKAITSRLSDPAVMDKYYSNYEKAVKSRAGKIVAQETLGKLDVAEAVVRKQNSIAFDYQVKAAKSQFELNSIINSYNIAKTQNDWDYETWKQENGIPEQVGESELQGYLAAKAKAQADKLRAEKTQEWLNTLLNLKDSGDPAATYLFNALIQGGYAPLQSMGVSIGGRGVQSNWQNVVVPGNVQGNPVDPANTAYPGWNPYSGWDNK